MATRGPMTFESRDDAVRRYLKLSGLTGLVDDDDPTVTAGVVAADGGWQLAQDPATFGFGRPDIAPLLAVAACPVLLARGEHDRLVSDEDLHSLVLDHATLPGLGHNAHVENPAAVLALLV